MLARQRRGGQSVGRSGRRSDTPRGGRGSLAPRLGASSFILARQSEGGRSSAEAAAAAAAAGASLQVVERAVTTATNHYISQRRDVRSRVVGALSLTLSGRHSLAAFGFLFFHRGCNRKRRRDILRAVAHTFARDSRRKCTRLGPRRRFSRRPETETATGSRSAQSTSECRVGAAAMRPF